MNLSKRILELRVQRGLTQLELANLLELSQSSYSRIENKAEKLSIEQLEKIADALDTSIIELLTGEALEDTDKIIKLERRVRELESIVMDKAELIKEKDIRFESLRNIFTEDLYKDMLVNVYHYPYRFSYKMYFNKKTKKTLRMVSSREEELIISDEEDIDKNSTKAKSKKDTDNLYSSIDLIARNLARENKVSLRDIDWDFVLNSDLKVVASVYYFNFLDSTEIGNIIKHLIDFKLLEDKVLLFGYLYSFCVLEGYFDLDPFNPKPRNGTLIDLNTISEEEHFALINKEFERFISRRG